MRSERDTTRIVRSWLEHGVTAMPDRVLDAVLAELPATPQRRSWWQARRLPEMSVVRIAVVAAVLVVAVAIGSALLGRNPATVGGLTTPSPTPSAASPSATDGASASPSPSVSASPRPRHSPVATSSGGDCRLQLLHGKGTGRVMDYTVYGYGFQPNMAHAPAIQFFADDVAFFELTDEGAAPEEQGTDEKGNFGGGFNIPDEAVPADEGQAWKAVATDGTCTAEVTFDPYEFR